MKPRIIAVEGFDGSGKSTLAKYISERWGYHYHKSPTGAFAQVRDYFDNQTITLSERLAFYTGDCIRVSMEMQQNPERLYVLDRYYFSTIAYHESKSPGCTAAIRPLVQQLQQPDLVFLIRTDFDRLVQRIETRDEQSLNDALFLKRELHENIYRLYQAHIPAARLCIIENNGALADCQQQIDHALKSL